MSVKIQPIRAIRGMNDLLPAQIHEWQYCETMISEVLAQFAYTEIRFPLLDKTELFKRSIGEVTDIIEKEMYTFTDRNGESLSLRPEGTASCVRAGIEHSLFYQGQQRLWYMGPMFRHERPQKGRYRQFHQLGVEAFGIPSVDIDLECLLINQTLFERLKIRNLLNLEINSLGIPEERARYREKLIHYFSQHKEKLDADSLRRLHTNPLRILDSKNPELVAVIANAPILLDELGAESLAHHRELLHYLDAVKISYTVNPRLVRGLDYYRHTVFEWTTTCLGAQNTVSAGGRYDSLVEQLGGQPTPAVGFALGIERLLEVMQTAQTPIFKPSLLVYFICEDTQEAYTQALHLTQVCRQTYPTLPIQLNCGGGKFKAQFKRADKSGAMCAFILGTEELAAKTLTIKFLRDARPQQTIEQNKLINFLGAVYNARAGLGESNGHLHN